MTIKTRSGITRMSHSRTVFSKTDYLAGELKREADAKRNAIAAKEREAKRREMASNQSVGQENQREN